MPTTIFEYFLLMNVSPARMLRKQQAYLFGGRLGSANIHILLSCSLASRESPTAKTLNCQQLELAASVATSISGSPPPLPWPVVFQ